MAKIEMNEENYRRFRDMRDDVEREYSNRYDSAMKSSFEYGITVIRHLYLIYGGALITLPALNSFGDFEKDVLIYAAAYFVVSIALNTLCAYSAHINWMGIARASEIHMHIQRQYVHDVWYSEKVEDFVGRFDKNPELKSLNRKITATMWLSHIFGIAGGVIFVFGFFKTFLSVMN